MTTNDPDYVMLHANHLAIAARNLLDAANGFHAAQEAGEAEDAGDAAHEALESAGERYSDCHTALRIAIYEFEKRRDRLASTQAEGRAK